MKSNPCFFNCYWEIFLAALLGKKFRSLWHHYTTLKYTVIHYTISLSSSRGGDRSGGKNSLFSSLTVSWVTSAVVMPIFLSGPCCPPWAAARTTCTRQPPPWQPCNLAGQAEGLHFPVHLVPQGGQHLGQQVHLESSRQFAHSVFSITNMLRIHGILAAVLCSNLVFYVIHLKSIVEYMITIHKNSL